MSKWSSSSTASLAETKQFSTVVPPKAVCQISIGDQSLKSNADDMKTSQLVPVLTLSALLSSLDEVAAHSKMLLPVTAFKDPSAEFSAVGGLDGTQWTYPNINSWDGAARGNSAMKQSNSKTLRQFLMKYYKPNSLSTTKECGQTILTGTRQPIPDSVNFPAGHEGPCEFWCDNYRIAFNENCNGNKITSVKLDKSKCSKASIIQGMYIGTQAQPWEIYINCAPIAGGTATDPSKVLDPNASGDGSGTVASESSGGVTSARNNTTPANSPRSPNPAPAPQSNPAPAPATGAKCQKRRK